jgi:hypothetical protein
VLARAVPAFFCSFSRRAAWHGPTRLLGTFFKTRHSAVGNVLSHDFLKRDVLALLHFVARRFETLCFVAQRFVGQRFVAQRLAAVPYAQREESQSHQRSTIFYRTLRTRSRCHLEVNQDRCYDFLNIFGEKFSGKKWRFDSKRKLNYAKF